MLTTILIFIAVLAILVLAHEWGHFIVARKNGIKVDEFGFGFPPRIFGVQIFKGDVLEKIAEKETVTIVNTEEKETIIDEKVEIDKESPIKKWRFVWGSADPIEEESPASFKGGTIYSLNWIPLGGFVRIKGEDGEFASESDSFGYKKIWQRVMVLVAGVTMNFVLAGVLLGIGMMIGLPQAIDSLGKGAIVKDHRVEIMGVLVGSPAEKADVQMGDQVVSLDGQTLNNVEELQKYVDEKKGQAVKFSVKRNGEEIQKEITPIELAETKKGGIGVSLIELGIVSYPWYRAIVNGFVEAGLMTWAILQSFGILFSQLFHGQNQLVDQLSGPVGIAVLTGRVARLGISYLLQFAAILSLNLAILNILPIPALDGGRVLFLIIEKFRGKPLRRRLENLIHTVGFAALMLLVVFVTYKDIVRFSGSFIRLGKKLIGG